jgi:putative membrane protein
LLLGIQWVAVTVFSLVPWVRQVCVRLVPKRIRHYQAAHRAYEEYLNVTQHVLATTPIVLLYISIAEHYAHILTSRSVREKIPGERWDNIIATLTTSIRSEGLCTASSKAIGQMAELLSPHFPDDGEEDKFSHSVIEIGH